MNFLLNRQERLLSEAIARHEAGALGEAESLYRNLLKMNPASAPARLRLGVVAYQSGRIESALKMIDSAAALEPGNAVYHMSLGAMLRHHGRLDEAEAACRRGLALDPGNPDAANNLGNVLNDQGDVAGAESAYNLVLKLSPGHPMASLSLAALYRRAQEYGQARGALGTVDSRCRGGAEFAAEWGWVCLDEGSYGEAEDWFHQALNVAPRTPHYLYSLGLAHQRQGRLGAAITCYDQAVGLNPGYAEARWQRAVVKLQAGDFAGGLVEWDWRHRLPNFQDRDLPQPLWTGQPPRTGRLLIHAEGGIADQIVSTGFLPLAFDLVPDSLVECDPRLVPPLRRAWPEAEIVAQSDPPDPACMSVDVSVRTPIPDLVKLVPADGADGAVPVGYLKADPDKITAFRRKLTAFGPAPYIGISWGADDGDDLTSAEWAPVLARPDVTWVSLHSSDAGPAVADTCHGLGVSSYRDPQLDPENDIDGLAALIGAVDEVVTTPGLIAALAGALGVPTRLLAGRAPAWYWGHEGAGVPFFPNITAYRQGAEGDWTEAIERLVGDL